MTTGQRRILVTRPRADAKALARRLAELDLSALIAPVIEIVTLPLVRPAGVVPDALGVTSANALLCPMRDWHGTPLFAVGEATAAAAQAAGFRRVREADGDAAALGRMLLAETPAAARLILLAGKPRKPDLERTLVSAGRLPMTVETYEARPASWSDAIAEDWRASPPIAALHFSRRSASLAVAAAAAAGLAHEFSALRHCCLSDDVAEALRNEISGPVLIAAEPRTASVLQGLTLSLRRV